MPMQPDGNERADAAHRAIVEFADDLRRVMGRHGICADRVEVRCGTSDEVVDMLVSAGARPRIQASSEYVIEYAVLEVERVKIEAQRPPRPMSRERYEAALAQAIAAGDAA